MLLHFQMRVTHKLSNVYLNYKVSDNSNLHLKIKWAFHAYLKFWCINTYVSYICKHCSSLMLRISRGNHRSSVLIRSCSFGICSKCVFLLIFKGRSWVGRYPSQWSQGSSPCSSDSKWSLFVFGTGFSCFVHFVCLEEEQPNWFIWKACSYLFFKDQSAIR